MIFIKICRSVNIPDEIPPNLRKVSSVLSRIVVQNGHPKHFSVVFRTGLLERMPAVQQAKMNGELANGEIEPDIQSQPPPGKTIYISIAHFQASQISSKAGSS